MPRQQYRRIKREGLLLFLLTLFLRWMPSFPEVSFTVALGDRDGDTDADADADGTTDKVVDDDATGRQVTVGTNIAARKSSITREVSVSLSVGHSKSYGLAKYGRDRFFKRFLLLLLILREYFKS